MYRGMEFYLQWNRFILSLNVRRFKLEDLVVDHKLSILDDIFRSIGKEPPSHEKALEVIEHDRRRRLHTNSREHRSTLQWEELCKISPQLTQEFLQLSHTLGYYEDKVEAC